MMKLDHIMKLRAHIRDLGWMHGGDLSYWLLHGTRERCTPQAQAVVAMIVGRDWCRRGDPTEPAVLVINNAPTRAELMALQSLAVPNHVVTRPPHMTPTLLPEDVCRVQALRPEYARRLRKWLLRAAGDRAWWCYPIYCVHGGGGEQEIPACASLRLIRHRVRSDFDVRRQPRVRCGRAGAAQGGQATC
jgi:hypothetical protein